MYCTRKLQCWRKSRQRTPIARAQREREREREREDRGHGRIRPLFSISGRHGLLSLFRVCRHPPTRTHTHTHTHGHTHSLTHTHARARARTHTHTQERRWQMHVMSSYGLRLLIPTDLPLPRTTASSAETLNRVGVGVGVGWGCWWGVGGGRLADGA